MKRRRVRFIARWSVTVAGLLVIGVGGLSTRWSIFYEGCYATVAVRMGTFYLWPGARQEAQGWLVEGAWQYDSWWLDHLRINIRRNHAWIPLWIPALALLLPAVVMWRHDLRQVAPGHCRKCNYDLTGNVSGRCPECGAPLPPLARPGRSTPP